MIARSDAGRLVEISIRSKWHVTSAVGSRAETSQRGGGGIGAPCCAVASNAVLLRFLPKLMNVSMHVAFHVPKRVCRTPRRARPSAYAPRRYVHSRDPPIYL